MQQFLGSFHSLLCFLEPNQQLIYPSASPPCLRSFLLTFRLYKYGKMF